MCTLSFYNFVLLIKHAFLQLALHFTGFGILQANICYAPAAVTLETRQSMLKSWQQRLTTVFDETPMAFPSMSNHQPVNGDYSQGIELPEDYKKPGDVDMEYGATVGQHMGRKNPYDK